MTSGQIFLMAMLTIFMLALAWQEWWRNNKPFAVVLAGIPVAAWLATIFGAKQ